MAIAGEVKGIGWGKSKKEAEQEAAKKALEEINTKSKHQMTNKFQSNPNYEYQIEIASVIWKLVIGICLEFEIWDLEFGADQTDIGNMTLSPIIIPIFLPNAGCRERCLFCNQKAVATEIPSPSSVRKFIEASITGLTF